MKLLLATILLVGLAFVSAEITPRFPPEQPVTVSQDAGSNIINGTVLPCDFDYYRIQTLANVQDTDWLRIQFDQTPEAEGDFGTFYVVYSEFDDLEKELTDNNNIVDTLGELPGPDNFLWSCSEAQCLLELSCKLLNGTYYIGVTAGSSSILSYSFNLTAGVVTIDTIQDGEPLIVFNDQRDIPVAPARLYNYAFYAIDIPEDQFAEGAYLLVNISRVSAPGTVVRLHYDDLPVTELDNGILDTNDDLDACIYQGCVDTATAAGEFIFDYPVNTQPRKSCECTTFEQIVGGGRQLTCNLTVDPCQMLYGRWYISVELPFRIDENDDTGLDYTLYATLITPTISELTRNTTYKGYVEPERQTHYKVNVPASEVAAGQTHLLVHIDNVRNGFVDVWIHQGLDGQADPRAGGIESCYIANTTCRTDDACNVVVEKCHFGPGTWYISVSIASDEDGFLIDDVDRLPISYTIRANWLEDAVPTTLVAGVPVHKYIGEALYDFYVIEVPPTIDTWLFVELYAQQEDTEVILSMLHGSLPGGECYDRPDFYCLTGDVRSGRTIQTGPAEDYVFRPNAREACTFMIQTCELEQGPLYLSVYGHHVGYSAYGDTTYYQVPVHYTLYADFDVALSIQSAISYSENVFERQYNHYYIRADTVVQGQYLSVEVTNIQHGIPQTLEAFVNYNYLAGNCPCYDHLYNCTGAVAPACGNNVPETVANFLPEVDQVKDFCTILVPACAFRSGVWYVSVLGVNEDLHQYTTPIGYTLTATIHDAPVIKPLIPGQAIADVVTQWNTTNQYTHYKVGAKPIPNHDLVIKVTYVQNSDFLSKHDNLRDALDIFVNRGGVAGDRCFDYSGRANIASSSYETVVIPACEWTDDEYFVAIQGNFGAIFPGRYTIELRVVEITDTQLVSGVSVYGRVSDHRYQHFFIDVPQDFSGNDLLIDLYTNSDQDKVTAFINKDYRAGEDQCYDYLYRCETESSCSWQIEACEVTGGRYYISVYGDEHQFYDIAVEFTLTATLKDTVTPLGADQPYTAHIQAGQIQHYSLLVQNSKVGDYITFLVDNVKHGEVEVFYNFNNLAGNCPCYDYTKKCTPADKWCEITVPSCEFTDGTYYFSVVGLDNNTPNPPLYDTPIGYTVEVDYITPTFVRPNVVRDRFEENTDAFQFVANERYLHYRVDVDQDDYDEGYQVIVEIKNVQEGALNVYWSDEEPSASAPSCQIAQICTSGLGAGSECYWQIPYCLSTPGRHYVTVQGITGRLQASFDILIYLQRPATVAQSSNFTLDDASSAFIFPAGAELNVTHVKTHEPNGWVQMINLDNLSVSDTDNGEILEIFFYRVVNNLGSPLAFNVYLNVDSPAGSDSCCVGTNAATFDNPTPVDQGNCINQPCAKSVPLTTYNPGNIIVPAGGPGAQPSRGAPGLRDDSSNNNLCLPTQVGTGSADPSLGASPYYGERCIVRVWACDLAAAQADAETSNWFLTVVPVAPPAPTSAPLNGLSYSVQWRVRNVRTDATTDANGSVDLTSQINIVDAPFTTQEYTVTTVTTESEGFGSFLIDVTSLVADAETNGRRVVIQTQFINGTGVVYIQPETFANPIGCNDYVCFSSQDCNDQFRFISSECCDLDVTRFYITVRNLGGTGTATSFRFRITEIVQPAVVEITLPYNIEVGTNVTDGLRGEEYDFYTFPITAEDLDYTNLVINITKLNNPGETLVVYVNFEALAGSDVGSNTNLYPTDEACYNYLYHRDVTGEDIFTLELSHCQLLPGNWYVSVFSPAFDLIGGQEDFQSYNLSIYFSDPPTDLSLGESRTDTYTPFGSSFFQYKLEVTAEDIEATNNGVDGFLTNFLHIEVSNFDGDIALFVNFDDIAGDDAYPNACNGNIGSDDVCASGSCIVELLPCDGDFTLKAGTYYIGVRVNGAGTWNVTATIVSETYTELTSTTENGDGHRVDTTNTIFTVTSDVAASPSEDGYYRYALNIADEFTSGRDYIVVNLTSTDNGLVADLSVEVFSQSCVQWDCAVDSALGWCIIDAVGFAPCTAKAGTYFFRVFNPSNSAFTLTVYQNETTVQDLEDSQTITEIIYPVEYEAFYYETQAIGVDASTLTIEVTSTCGSVEVFVQKDTIGGPSSDDGECSITSCVTTADGTGESNSCTLFLDVCTYEQRGYYITVRGNNQEFPNEANPNLYLPIRYTLKATQTNITTIPIAANCPAVVAYTTDETAEPTQFYYDLENAEVGSTLRFTLSVPSQVYDADKVASITVTFQYPVTYSGNDCDYVFEPMSCTVDDLDSHCTIETTSQCNSIEGRYYIWADAPRGSVVYVELYDAVVPIVDDGEVISATINAGSNAHLDFPYRPNVQHYRYDVEPKNDEHFLLTIRVSEISQGAVSVYTSIGQYPLEFSDSSDSCFAETLDFSCFNVEEGENCILNLGFCDLGFFSEAPGYHPVTLWVTIVGEAQTCELHSVKYNIEFERHNEPTIFEVNQAVCQTAEHGEYSNYHLSSRTKSRPQDYVLNFVAKDITGGEIMLNLIDNEGFPATENCADFNTQFTSVDINDFYICGFNDLTFSVLGNSDNGLPVNYNLAVNQVSILLNQLEENVPFVKDESCSTANRQPTGFDYFYYKRSTSRSSLSYISFIIEALSEETVLEIYPRTTLLGGPGCIDSDDVLTLETIAPGVYRVLDTGCSDFAKDYYLTISATGPYQVTAVVGKEIVDLTLDEATDVLIPVGETLVYKLEIASTDIPTADSRLILEFSGIVGPSFVATVNSGDRASTGFLCSIDEYAANSGESSYFVLEVPTCVFTDGTYYITLTQQANPLTDVSTCANVTVVLTAVVVPYEVDITSVNINTVLTGETVSLITRDVNTETPYKFYRIKSALNADEAFGQARLLNVEGGTVTLFVTESSFSMPSQAWFPGSRFGTHRTYPISGVLPHTSAAALADDFSVVPCGADGCADACCTASDSCALTITPCTWGSASYYLAVAAVSQDAADVPITYDLVLNEYPKYTEITPNSNKVDSFDGNFANHYYAGITTGQQSIRFRTQVINGEGVLVTVRNHQCPEQATWVREVYCSSRFYDNEFQCDVDVSTRAQHPGSLTTTFFATVTGSNATYSISFFAGRQNCHDFTGTGSREGLNFCQSLVPYSTYRWDDYSKRDSAAKCLFNELYDHFRVQPCWSGVTVDCNSTLQRFACYENFHRCDEDGFAVGTCRKACEAVVYECVNWFESVDLEHYNCTSPRYIDSNHACTGHLENDAYDTIPALIDDPLDIIYQNDLPRGAASSLSTSFALVFLALIAALFF